MKRLLWLCLLVLPLAHGGEKERRYFTDTVLLTQEGKAVRFYSDVLKGRIVVIHTFFTHCEAACPLIVRKLLKVRKALGPLAERITFISISIDPERDTPERLRAFAKRHGADVPGWIFLTGRKADVDLVVSRLGQYVPEVEEHSTLLLVGNVEARHWSKLRPDTPAPAIALKLESLAGD